MLADITVCGEISNFTPHKSGHFYFTLKDDGAVLRSVMFRYSAQKVTFTPQSGMKVKAKGRISVFPRDGQYQLYVTSMIPDGEGSLNIAYEQLKAKLESMGMFDEQKKKPLPKIPKTIGVITSPTGAAVRDMIDITGRRFPYAKLILYPSLVQGESAAEQLADGIKYFNAHSVDVIIIGRGGGSIEDLWAFNDEKLAYTVFASKIPVVSAVGHETDFTICDYVADKRAPTPSAAAELVTPETSELKQKFCNITKHIGVRLTAKLESERSKIEALKKSRHLSSPKAQLDDKRMLIMHHSETLTMRMKLIANEKRGAFAENASRLSALNPLDVISRGYGAVYSDGGRIIDSVKKLKCDDTVCVRLSDGEIKADVRQINEL